MTATLGALEKRFEGADKSFFLKKREGEQMVVVAETARKGERNVIASKEFFDALLMVGCPRPELGLVDSY